MTPTSENDQRRKKLLTQLAAILQTDVGLEEAPRPEPAAPLPSPEIDATAELQELGLLVEEELGKSPQSPARSDSIARVLPAVPKPEAAVVPTCDFVPLAPTDLAKLHLAEIEVESLALKLLLHRQTVTGREVAYHLGIAFGICDKLLHALKADRMVIFKAAAGIGDYVYELTEAGRERAHKFSQQCGYFGTAPVCLDDYIASVEAQSLQKCQPQAEDLRRAFGDLALSEETFERLGRAIVSGKGLFLHGPPGNGKTSIAQRVTRAYGESIWIPRALSAWGEIIRVFDPSCHKELPVDDGDGVIGGKVFGAEKFGAEKFGSEKIDRRWVKIRRPTIVVGGELILDNLEITPNPVTGIAESPLQLKSNCGTLVIDDFGRQQVAPAALLNRWIVPLEKRHDYLNLPSGRKIRVPFDQFIVFSTNLEPRELVDEAFLRRIPYKIDVSGPTEEQFRTLFLQLAVAMDIEPSRASVDHLIEQYYRKTNRTMRFCHPRDLLRQVKVYYDFLEEPARLSIEAIDAAAADYFSVL